MTTPHIHIVGAGLSGLAAAVRLAEGGARVTVYESAGHAGGRCRTFHDRTLDREIDNGNHLIMSGNRSALDYLARIGARDALTGPAEAAYPFVDVKSGRRWRVRINDGLFPAWIFDPKSRVPETSVLHYLKAAGIAFARADQTVADLVDKSDPLYRRFWEPLTLAVLNTTPDIGQARLLWAVIRETFALGGGASRPLAAREGLGPAFIDPALKFLGLHGASVRFNTRVRALGYDAARIASLDVGEETIAIGPGDSVILAVPPSRLKQLLPDLDPPDDDASILNVHYRTALPVPRGALGDAPFIGMLSSDAHWCFVRGDVVSLTVSASHAIGMDDVPNALAATAMWRETQVALDLGDMPFEAVRVIRERRATPDQSPASVAKRLKPMTRWRNLTLAGDHTDTGVPATIEGSIRSGDRAAAMSLEKRNAA
ncbi:MAG: hydroxysqualene dehydroxylase HpnE [Parvularculaceae bacterium]|nr:hydroxysqualene dehydroxylase HpnE [Parvularculaceae bacterium]